jgi:DHA1 family multidrug resistance protein-like MFS transporter
METVRDAPFGQLVRYITQNKYFRYPEEKPGFELPNGYKPEVYSSASHTEDENESAVPDPNGVDAPSQQPEAIHNVPEFTEEKDPNDNGNNTDMERLAAAERTHTQLAMLSLKRTETLPYTAQRLEVEQRLELEKRLSRPINPTKTSDGLILVDWYTTDDPANPQNWSGPKKAWVVLLIALYTFAVYASSSIYVPSVPLVMERFGIQEFKASLPLALYVFGYGTGPLLFSPMSEIPFFGRSVPYVATFAVYVALGAPTAVVDNLGAFVFLRFLQGFFGSPCLANGGATMQDMYSLLYLPYPIALWVASSFAGPAVGPLLSGFAVVVEGWHWAMWIILWLAAPVFVLWVFFLPETSASNILLRRAARLRRLTGNERIRSQTEIDRKGLTFKTIFVDAVVKPIEITFKDPAVVCIAFRMSKFDTSLFLLFIVIHQPLYRTHLWNILLFFRSLSLGLWTHLRNEHWPN